MGPEAALACEHEAGSRVLGDAQFCVLGVSPHSLCCGRDIFWGDTFSFRTKEQKSKNALSEISWPNVPQCACWTGLLFIPTVERWS